MSLFMSKEEKEERETIRKDEDERIRIENKEAFEKYKREKEANIHKKIILCKNCKNEIEDDCMYCKFCGTEIDKDEEIKKLDDALTRERSDIKICGTCGSEIPIDYLFCKECGNSASPNISLKEEFTANGNKISNGVNQHQGIIAKSRKKIYIYIVIATILVIIISGGIYNASHPASTSSYTPPVSDSESIASKEQYMLTTIQNGMSGMATVTLDGRDFCVLPTDTGLINEIRRVMDGQSGAVASWDKLVQSSVDESNAISLQLPGYELLMMNPTNPDLFLLEVMDGNIIYNFASQE